MWTVVPFYEITMLHNCNTGCPEGIMGFREHIFSTSEKSGSRNFKRVTQMVCNVP